MQTPLSLLALLLVPAVVLQELRRGSVDVHQTVLLLTWLSWLALAVDFIVVLTLSKHRRSALRAHWFEAVVVAAASPLPVLLGPTLRLSQLLRFARLGQLGMVVASIVGRQRRRSARPGLHQIALFTGLVVVLSSLAEVAFDSKDFPSVGRGLWWSIVTITTVGYGDYTPHTAAGRIVAVALMLVGIGFLSMLTATIAARFIAREAEQEHAASARLERTLERIEERLERLEQIAERQAPPLR